MARRPEALRPLLLLLAAGIALGARVKSEDFTTAEEGQGGRGLKCCCDTNFGLEGVICRRVESKWTGGCPIVDLGRGKSQTHWAGKSNLEHRCESKGPARDVPELRCCCDDAKGLEGAICRFRPTTQDGGCPAADLGRGRVQTNPAEALELDDRCELLDEELFLPREHSTERLACEARELLDSKVFPPEKHANAVLRMALPGMPGVGDVFFKIDDIDVTEVDLVLRISRRSDTTFHFEIVGPGENNPATVRLLLRGLDLYMPDSVLDKVASIVSKTENIFGSVFSLGYARNYGRIDEVPVDVDLAMSGEFASTPAGGWAIVPGTPRQRAELSLGYGGLLMKIASAVINKLGGMDQIFFDRIWPLLERIFPERLNRAFHSVPHRNGQVRQEFRVAARCRSRKGRRCLGQDLEVRARAGQDLFVQPRPMLRQLLHSGFLAEGTVAQGMLRNLVQAYERRGRAFAGYAGDLGLEAGFTPELALVVSVKPDLTLPVPLLQSLVGPGVSLADFAPPGGSMRVGGSMSLVNGALAVEQLSVEHLVLPLVVGAEKQHLEFSGAIESLTFEIEDATEDLAFAKDSPLTLSVPHVQIELNPDRGLFVQTPQPHGSGLFASLEPESLLGLLRGAARGMLVPPVVRNESAEKPDGQLPEGLRRPWSHEPQQLDLPGLLGTLQQHLQLAGHTLERQGREHVSLAADLNLTAILPLDHKFWQFFLSSGEPDYGYAHLRVPGYFGNLEENGAPPSEKALASITCGDLKVYALETSIFLGLGDKAAEPYDEEPLLSLDLRSEEARGLMRHVAVRQLEGGTECLYVRTGTYFCAQAAEVKQLQEAMQLQVERLAAAQQRWPAACVPGPHGSAPVCPGNPDGTWFKPFAPLVPATWFPGTAPPEAGELRTPVAEWEEAARRLGA